MEFLKAHCGLNTIGKFAGRRDDCAEPSVFLERESIMVQNQGTELCGGEVVHGCYTRGNPRPEH
jgi:hypothetical protein